MSVCLCVRVSVRVCVSVWVCVSLCVRVSRKEYCLFSHKAMLISYRGTFKLEKFGFGKQIGTLEFKGSWKWLAPRVGLAQIGKG